MEVWPVRLEDKQPILFLVGGSAATALSKITTYLAVTFMGLALLITLLGRPTSGSAGSVVEQAQEEGSLETPTEMLSLPNSPVLEKENN